MRTAATDAAKKHRIRLLRAVCQDWRLCVKLQGKERAADMHFRLKHAARGFRGWHLYAVHSKRLKAALMEMYALRICRWAQEVRHEVSLECSASTIALFIGRSPLD